MADTNQIQDLSNKTGISNTGSAGVSVESQRTPQQMATAHKQDIDYGLISTGLLIVLVGLTLVILIRLKRLPRVLG